MMNEVVEVYILYMQDRLFPPGKKKDEKEEKVE